jgi:hypothetical protein
LLKDDDVGGEQYDDSVAHPSALVEIIRAPRVAAMSSGSAFSAHSNLSQLYDEGLKEIAKVLLAQTARPPEVAREISRFASSQLMVKKLCSAPAILDPWAASM